MSIDCKNNGTQARTHTKHEHKHTLLNLNYRKEERCRYGYSYVHAQVHGLLHLSSTRAGQTFGLLGEERAHAHHGCSLARRKTEKCGTRRRGTKFWEKSPMECCSVCVTIECRSAFKCAEQKHYRHCHVFHHETMHTEHSEAEFRGVACARENHLSRNTFSILRSFQGMASYAFWKEETKN